MDRFLDSFYQKNPAQRTVIVVLGTVIFLIVLAFFYVVTTPSTTSKSGNSQQPNQVQGSPVPAVSTMPSQQFPKETPGSVYEYTGNYFQISFPVGSFTVSGNKDNGQDHIVLEHNATPSGSFSYAIDIQVQPSSELPLSQITNIFDSYKFAKSNITVSGVGATKYKGAITGTNSVSHDTVVVFSNQSLTYKLQLTYKTQEENQEAENAFNRILASFRAIVAQ